MLSVGISKMTAGQLQERSGTISNLLAEIPADISLWEAGDEHISPGSPTDQLWTLLRQVDGIDWVIANKLLARKRPMRLPVYDRLVRDLLGHPDRFWLSLRDTLAAEHAAHVARLTELRDRSGIGDDISLLRVFDVICWMHAKRQLRAAV